jgi:hypothetical protein
VPVARDLEQLGDALEPGLARQIARDLPARDRRDGIDHDVAVVHRIAATGLDVRMQPDAHAAPDASASDSIAQPFREYHLLPGSGKRQLSCIPLEES